jgi:peptidoglycan/xylan/chitin deacetylase (PgdA/CDA1 family)
MQDLVDFQSHSVKHPHLAEVEVDKADYEALESKKAIENITGKPVFVFSYPFGNYNQNVINIVKKYYKYALTTNRGVFYSNGAGAYEIKRIAVLRSTSIKQFIDGLESR